MKPTRWIAVATLGVMAVSGCTQHTHPAGHAVSSVPSTLADIGPNAAQRAIGDTTAPVPTTMAPPPATTVNYEGDLEAGQALFMAGCNDWKANVPAADLPPYLTQAAALMDRAAATYPPSEAQNAPGGDLADIARNLVRGARAMHIVASLPTGTLSNAQIPAYQQATDVLTSLCDTP